MCAIRYLLAALLLSSLVACGGGSGNSDSGNNSGSSDDENSSENDVAELRFSETSVALPQYTQTSLELEAVKDNGDTEPLLEGVEYTSGDESIITLELVDSGIKLNAVSMGTTFITASYADHEVSMEIEVTSPVLESLSILGASSLALGETLSLSVEAHYQGSVTMDVTDSAQFEVEDEGILLPDEEQTNRFIPQAAGSTIITAAFGGVAEEFAVEVLPALLQSTEITPDSAEIIQGESLQFNLTGHYGDGSEKDITDQADWSVDNGEVGGFSSDEAGLFQSEGYGSAVVTAAVNDLVVQADLYVVEAPDEPASVTLFARPDVLRAGLEDWSSVEVVVSANSEDGTIADGTEVVIDYAGVIESQTFETLDGRFTFDFAAPADSGEYSLTASVVDSTVEGSINVRAVDSFSSVLSMSQSSDTVRINGYYQAGSSFTAAISNTSNREFQVISAEVLNGEDIINTFEAADYPDTFNEGILGGGESIEITASLNTELRDDGVTIRFNLRDETTGEEFSKTSEVFRF